MPPKANAQSQRSAAQAHTQPSLKLNINNKKINNMKNDNNPTIVDLIKGDVRSWIVGKVLSTMTETILEIKKTNEQLGRLINKSLKSGNDYLELSKRYSKGSKDYLKNLEKAREHFHESANVMLGLDKSHSYYLAGLCADLLNDKTSKIFYYQKSYNNILEFQETLKTSSHEKTEMVGGLTGLGTGIIALIGSAFLPIAAPAVFIAGGIYYLAKGASSGIKEQSKKNEWFKIKSIDDIHCAIPNTTWSQLEFALMKNLGR